MTTIAILPESAGASGTTWRAVAGEKESSGRTAGEALDGLTMQLSDAETSTLVIVQRLQPDNFFTGEQRQRLELLIARWQEARDGNTALPSTDQSELEALVETELMSATKRAEAIVEELGR